MCRNIRNLYNFEPPATDEEIRASAEQFVRKISGFTKPSKANEEAFEQAVDDVAARRRRACSASWSRTRRRRTARSRRPRRAPAPPSATPPRRCA